MLASFIIVYIVIRTQLNPSLAPLPTPGPGDPVGRQKLGMFGGFLSIVVVGLSALLFLRALVLTMTGLNANLPEHKESIFLGMSHHLPWLAVPIVVGLVLILFVFGRERSMRGWQRGKGLVPPLIVISIVLGSIYGGVTGITEAAGMGALAVFLIALVRGEASFGLVWDSLMRTLRSTGTIIWVTVGAAALSGAYTLAGGPGVHRGAHRRGGDADAAGAPDDDGHPAVHGRLHGLGRNRPPDSFPCSCRS